MRTSPPSLSRVAARPRLFRAIDAHPEARIVWLHAPAGSGKTSLAAGYAAARSRPTLWYQIDESDGDPAGFFLELSSREEPAADSPERPFPVYDPGPGSSLIHFSRLFSRRLVSRYGDLTLVIDDFHAAPDAALLSTILVNMASATQALRILVASRRGPPPTLARAQLHGDLVLLSWTDLRLRMDEARDVVTRIGSAVGDSLLTELHQASDGWAAGLVLLARRPSLPRGGLPVDAPERGLLDAYLRQEVLAQTAPAQRGWLVAAALLPEFDPESLAELLDETGVPTELPQLENIPFLTCHSGGTGPRWSAHPLLREFLLAELEVEFGRSAEQLRMRAARILLRRGDIDPGLRLLERYGGSARLKDALCGSARSWLAQGRHVTLETWLGRLPSASIAADPWPIYWLGRATVSRDPAKAIATLQEAAHHFRAANDQAGRLLACTAVLDAMTHEYSQFERMEPWLDEAAALQADMAQWLDAEQQAEVMTTLFSALVQRQRPHPLLEEWRERAQLLASRSNNANLIAHVAVAAAMSQVWSGNYRSASAMVPILRLAIRSPAVGILVRLSGWVVLSVIDGNMPSGVPSFLSVEEGLTLANESDVHVWDAELHGQEAVIAMAAGQMQKATLALQAMRACLRNDGNVHSAGFHVFTAWHCLLEGDAAAAARAAASALADATASASMPLTRQAVVMSTLASIALGRFDLADAQLASAEHVLNPSGGDARHPRTHFVGGLLRAELARRTGLQEDVCRHLALALSVGAAEGYTSFYGWLPEMMSELAVIALAHGIEVDYVRTLIRLRGLMPRALPLNVPNWPWSIEVRTLGVVRIQGIAGLERTGVRMPTKPIELLLALIARGGRDVAQEHLCDALWPDAEGDASQRSLETTLHRLRRLLGDGDLVSVQGGRLSLDAARIWVDAWALDRWLDELGDEPVSRAFWERIVDLYRGPFLVAIDAAWAARPREQLRQRLRHAARVADPRGEPCPPAVARRLQEADPSV